MANQNEKVTAEEVNKYAKNYSDDGFWEKIRKNAKKIGLKLIYEALKLWYVAQKPEVPMTVKASIFASLGYLISPLDLAPDMIPVIGYTDDTAAIGMALMYAQMYIDQEVQNQAKAKIDDIFGAGTSAGL